MQRSFFIRNSGVMSFAQGCALLLCAACWAAPCPAIAQFSPNPVAPSQAGTPPRGGPAGPILRERTPAASRTPHGSTTAQPPAPQATTDAPLTLPNLLNEPARRASVKVESGKLAIHAENASLSQILKDLASSSGMKLDGFSQDQRIFGTYGPGEPRDVLSALLVGSGYNVLMVGDAGNGIPRELSLSQRAGGPPPPNNNVAQPSNQDQQPDEDVDSGEVQEPEPPPQNNLPPDNGQQAPGGVRTPQQLLEQLQRMHQPPPPQ